MALFYQNNQLCIGSKSTNLLELVSGREEAVYVYDLNGMKEQAEKLQKALGDTQIHYAVKANAHPKVLELFAKIGLGADVVSGGELKLARKAGVPAEKIIFSGVAKSRSEIELALSEQIYQINVESLGELHRIGEMTETLGLSANVALRINPDVNPVTHPYITTGFRENKFGLSVSTLPEIFQALTKYSKTVSLQGVTIHIGSQLLDLSVFEEAIEKTLLVVEECRTQGFELKTFDIGGGVGINYETGTVDDEFVSNYGQSIQRLLKPSGLKVLAEPGRVLTACHGVLLGQIQYLKCHEDKNFAILNTGMHHLIRPALYQAYHRILPVLQREGPGQVFDIVGPICESADFLGKNRRLSPLQEGDWLAIAESGAYGRSMACEYNAHELPEELVIGY